MRILYTLLCLLLSCYALHAQADQPTQAEVDSLLSLARTDTLSFYVRSKAGIAASKAAVAIGDQESAYQGRLTAGIAFLQLGKYQEALETFQNANRLALDLDSTRYIASTFYFLGTVHTYLQQPAEAMTFFEQAVDAYSQLADYRWVGILTNSIGIAQAQQGDPKAAMESYQKALDILETNGMEAESAIALANIGNHYLDREEPAKAIPYLEEALERSHKHQVFRNETVELLNLGMAHRNLGHFPRALNYFRQSLDLAEKHQLNNFVYSNYKELSETYKQMGKPGLALEHYEKFHDLRDSVFNAEKNAQISELQVLYETELKERQIAEQNETILQLEQKRRINNLILFGAAIGLVAFLAIGYLWITRQRVRHRLTRSQLRNKELESQQLRRELEFKKRDLTNFALDIARKNEFSNEVHAKLQEILENQPPKSKQLARQLLHYTSQHLKINEDIQEFQMNVETVNQDFFHRLNERFPELTPNEKQLCGLIRLNLSTKEIAAIRNITPRSAEMGRYRLRKKLHLQPEEEIQTFLQEL